MKRGEVWIAAARGAYTGKPRPVVVVQSDLFDATESITAAALTTDPTVIPLLRVPIMPSTENGLTAPSAIMVDKLTTMPRANLRERIGALTDGELVQLGRSIVVFLGLG